MKQLLSLLVVVTFFVSCKNDKKKDIDELKETTSKSYSQNDGLITLKGDFIYMADAAVIQTKNEIYGVIIDEQMHKLNDAVAKFKKEETDMIPVTVRAKRTAKPAGEEGWPFRLEIKEIIKVEAPNPEQNDVIKLEN